eukprot:490333-Rhodomonas_salina.1
MSETMSQWSSSSALGRKSRRLQRCSTWMADRQSVRIARGWEGRAACRTIVMAAYSLRMGTASPPTCPNMQ